MNTYEVVYNACYGGFSVSEELCKEYEKITGKSVTSPYQHFNRHDKVLVELVKELGSERSSGFYAKLKVDTIYGKVYRIDDYDGMETVITPENQDWIVIEEELKEL